MNFNINTYMEPKNDFNEKNQLHLNENLLEENLRYLKEINKNIVGYDVNLNRYPESGNYLVKSSIASDLSINIENLFIDNGSANIIRKIFKRYIKLDGNILIPYPSWSFYSKTLDFLEQKYKYYNLLKKDKGFSYDINLIEKEIHKNKTKIVLICTPNNPTGNKFDIKQLDWMVKKYPEIIFIIDQAYYGFEDNNEDNLAIKNIEKDNIYIIRTMSKFYGLANLRLGFLISNKKNIIKLNNLSTVFGVPTTTQYIVRDRLKQKQMDNLVRLEYNLIKKYILSFNVLLKNFEIFESSANFFLIKIIIFSEKIIEYFFNNGYIVKMENLFNQNYIRFTISNLKTMKDFMNKLVNLDKSYGI